MILPVPSSWTESEHMNEHFEPYNSGISSFYILYIEHSYTSKSISNDFYYIMISTGNSIPAEQYTNNKVSQIIDISTKLSHRKNEGFNLWSTTTTPLNG